MKPTGKSRWVDAFSGPTQATVAGVLERVLPSVAMLHARVRLPTPPPTALVCVYRLANANTVRRLLQAAGSPERIALWGLDGVAPELADYTVGTGPGLRLPLINRLVQTLEIPSDGWLLVCDDDVEMRRGSLCLLVRSALALGLDVAQPSHGYGSAHSWPLHAHRVLTLARSTRFVETGPLLAFSPQARATCLPLPNELGMGWGSEVIWGTEPALRTGIIDALTMVHLGRVASAYDASALRVDGGEGGLAGLRAAGYTSVEDLQVEQGRWRAWHRRPEWARPLIAPLK